MKHLTTAVVILMLGLTAVFAQNTGKTKGWPTAILAKRGFPNLKQPAGVQSSYTVDDRDYLIVYMTGANKNTFQGLKQQIEKVTGKPMQSFKGVDSTIVFWSTNMYSSPSGYGAFLSPLRGNFLELTIYENIGDE